MKVAVLVLLLANLAVFAWLRWIHETAPGPDAGLVAPAAGGVQIRLLPATTKLERPAVAAAGGSGPECLLTGPMADASGAHAAAAALAAAGVGARAIRSTVTTTQGYQVLLGGFGSAAAAESAAARLRRAGLRDVAVVTAAGQGAVISAGLFRLAADASRRVAQLRALGFAPQVQEQTSTAVRWNLVFPASAGARAAASAAGVTALSPTPCSTQAPAAASRPRTG